MQLPYKENDRIYYIGSNNENVCISLIEYAQIKSDIEVSIYLKH